MFKKAGDRQAAVVPAQVAFLTIYNPSLGNTEDTLHDQIVFYSSQHETNTGDTKNDKEGVNDSQEQKNDAAQQERNERLRQVGLAQGMIEFARGFSDGEAIDSVETEKSRIILHELERGWWILASIDLTRLPSNKTSSATSKNSASAAIEYSSREVSPPGLLLQQLLRAHAIFLLHNASSLDELYVRLSRTKFCHGLSLFWTKFIWNWDVLLSGNPAVDAFRGIKLAPGGELGIGVGEEEWGSGERDVLEGFVGRVDGMVDLIVSRYGDSPESEAQSRQGEAISKKSQTWATPGARPGPSDGMVFSGVKAVSRESIRALTSWTEWLYMYGEGAYGLRDDPDSAMRTRRRRPPTDLSKQIGGSFESVASAPWSLSEESKVAPQGEAQPDTARPGVPPPIVSAAEASLKVATNAASGVQGNADPSATDTTTSETFMKYLTLGYGSHWGFSSDKAPADKERDQTPSKNKDRSVSGRQESQDSVPPARQRRQRPLGSFLIGLQGDLETEEIQDADLLASGGSDAEVDTRKLSSRISVRTVYMEVGPEGKGDDQDRSDANGTSHDGKDGSSGPRHKKMRVVVYMCQPFIFTFVFELRAPTLAISSFYRSIHEQLKPLQRPLLASTSPTDVSERLQTSGNGPSTSKEPIFDLIYDPKSLTVHSTIPNIPEPNLASANASGTRPDATDSRSRTWSRVEALNVHTQILNTWTVTQGGGNADLERTCKTSRGWWIVWMRLPASQDRTPSLANSHGTAAGAGADAYRQAFLVRKASDYEGAGGARSWRERAGAGGGSAGTSAMEGWAPGKLAEGIGVDARKYIEGLLSLSR